MRKKKDDPPENSPTGEIPWLPMEDRNHTVLRSVHNPSIRILRRFMGQSNFRGAALFPIEGPKLLEEALAAGISLETVVWTPQFTSRRTNAALIARLRAESKCCLAVEDSVLQSLSATEQNRGILAVGRRPKTNSLAAVSPSSPIVLILADVQDPGNCGALARSHAAFGGNVLVTLGATADLLAPKALRASAGAVMRLTLLHFPTYDAFREQEAFRGLPLLAAVTRGGCRPEAIFTQAPFCLAIGNESSGLSEEILRSARETVSLPMHGATESLNAAVAGSLILYELSRRSAIGPFPTP